MQCSSLQRVLVMGWPQQVGVMGRGCCPQWGLVVVRLVMVMEKEGVCLHSWTGSGAVGCCSLACCRPHKQLT